MKKLPNRQRLTVFVDLDNTLADLNTAIEDRLRDWGYDFDSSRRTWDITHWFTGISPKEAKRVVNRVFTDDGMWRGLKPRQGAISVVKAMHKRGHRIYVVTAPWVSHQTCMWEKSQWVRHHMRWLDLTRLMFVHDKHLLRGDLIIDDKPEHVQGFSGRGVLISYPYNQDAKLEPGQVRAETWAEVDKIVKEIEGENG